MVCASCGAANPEHLRVCGQCGRGLPSPFQAQLDIGSAQVDVAAAPETAIRRQFKTGVLSPPPEGSQFATQGIPPTSASASQPSFTSGSFFGARYRIESLLGQGGMGSVYKAFDTELDRTVALKLVRPELAASSETMQRFKQELLLASKISHKNVLRIYDLGDCDGIKFITMAFVDGTDLAGCIEAGRLPLDRALKFTTQLCAALDAAHREGVVHRDLKPQNILIDRDDRLFVSDFGLAKSLAPGASSMTRVGQLLGTPRYMSPEQVEGKEVDHRSDLYSLGLILFEIFTGELPFRGESALQIMFQRVTAAPKDPKALRKDLPDYLVNIILKCLERDPANRYQDAREILADLQAHNGPAVSSSTRTATLKIERTKPSRLPWLLLTGILLAVALLLSVPKTRHLIFRSAPPAAESGRPAIQHYLAVLPFQVVGNKQDVEYISEGVVDSLLAKLAAMKNVYVAPPNAVNAALKQRDPKRIAQTLGVRLLLEGTITGGSNGAIAIAVTLEDTKDQGRNLLHQVFKADRQDLLTLEDQIFSQLVSALDIKQTREELARNRARPTQNVTAYEYYMKGRNLWHESENKSDLQKAIDLFEQAINVDPQFALAYAGIADADRRIFDQTHDGTWTQKALSAAERAKGLNDTLPEVHFTLGSIYTTTGRNAEALAELQRALQLSPNSDEALRRLGTAYLRIGQHKDALAAYARAIEVNPYLWTNYYSLGNAYFRLGENERALATFQRITELDPGRAEGWGAVGAAYFQMGRWSESLTKFKKAVDLQPKATFYSNLGTAYYYLGRYDEAAKVFEVAVSMEPNNGNLLVNLADAYRWFGQKTKAAATYDRAISLAYKSIALNPKDSEALGNLAVSYAKKGDSQRASKFIARARSIDPNDNALMYEEATIQALAGRTKEAQTSLAEALRNGYPMQEARSDPEFKMLRDLPAFNRLGNEISEQRAK